MTKPTPTVTNRDYDNALPADYFNVLTINVHSIVWTLIVHTIEWTLFVVVDALYDVVDAFIKSFTGKLHAFIITETWLKGGVNDPFYHDFDKYNSVFINRSGDMRAGGVCIYVHESIDYEILLREEALNSYHAVIKLKDLGTRLGGIYRDPNNDADS